MYRLAAAEMFIIFLLLCLMFNVFAWSSPASRCSRVGRLLTLNDTNRMFKWVKTISWAIFLFGWEVFQSSRIIILDISYYIVVCLFSSEKCYFCDWYWLLFYYVEYFAFGKYANEIWIHMVMKRKTDFLERKTRGVQRHLSKVATSITYLSEKIDSFYLCFGEGSATEIHYDALLSL